jgi:hypothetical protein
MIVLRLGCSEVTAAGIGEGAQPTDHHVQQLELSSDVATTSLQHADVVRRPTPAIEFGEAAVDSLSLATENQGVRMELGQRVPNPEVQFR